MRINKKKLLTVISYFFAVQQRGPRVKGECASFTLFPVYAFSFVCHIIIFCVKCTKTSPFWCLLGVCNKVTKVLKKDCKKVSSCQKETIKSTTFSTLRRHEKKDFLWICYKKKPLQPSLKKIELFFLACQRVKQTESYPQPRNTNLLIFSHSRSFVHRCRTWLFSLPWNNH